MRATRVISSSIALLFAVVRIGVAQNIVSNPGFETGDFSDWVEFGNTVNNGVDGQFPHSGDFAAYFGPVESTGGIFQTLSTSPGTAYTFSFWLQNGNDEEPAEFFEAWWDGAPVYTLSNALPFSYTLFTFGVVATAVTTDIMFNFQNVDWFWDFDDVSVIAASSTVPEPATMALLATGLVALAGAGARRRMRG
jgi:hypothetical protein